MGLVRGSVRHPALALPGQRGAGCTQAPGHPAPLFVLPLRAFLPVPALRKPTPRICHCHPCPRPLCRLPALLLLLPLFLQSIISFVPFHLSLYEKQWREDPSGPQPTVYLSPARCFPKSDYQGFTDSHSRIFCPSPALCERVCDAVGGGGGSCRRMRVTAARML